MTLASIPFLLEYIQHNGDIPNMPSLNSPFAITISSYFISFLWADLLLGYFYYLSSFNLITGFVHHALYTIVPAIMLIYRLPSIVGLGGLFEFPTIFLSLGHLHKPLRQDVLFGVSFFGTRIVYASRLILSLKTGLFFLFIISLSL
jgi:hypothetical protein